MERIEGIRKRFDNRLVDSDKWTEFYNNHEPDVAELLSLIDKYTEERDSANRVSMASLEQVITSGTTLLHQEEVRKSIQNLDRIKEEHKRYKEALEFYANNENNEWSLVYGEIDQSNVMRDDGYTAREALGKE